MYIQKINSNVFVSQNQQTGLAKKPCPCKNLKNDTFVGKNSNVTFGDSVTGGFWGYLIGSVVGLAAVAAAPVTGGLSMAAIFGAAQVGGTVVGSKIGSASDKD